MKKLLLTIPFIGIILSGCQGLKEKSAKVVDSVVEGMEYQCAGFVKYTKADGVATCKHMPITFKVGEILLGQRDKMPSDGVILPQDIVGVSRANIDNENVKKVIVLLQSLDADHNPENGIKITKNMRSKLNIFIDLKNTSMNDLKDIVEAQTNIKSFQKDKDAIEHLKRSMRRYNIK